jgi:Carboxypeptidase regulatory-like domain
MRTAVAIATLLFSLVAFGDLAQAARGLPAQPIPTGRLAGRIVDAETGEALSNARVTLTSGDGSTSVLLTDPDGRFGLDVPAGTYRLSVARAGFARADFGARRFGDPGRLLEIAQGTVVDGIEVGLARGAAVTPLKRRLTAAALVRAVRRSSPVESFLADTGNRPGLRAQSTRPLHPGSGRSVELCRRHGDDQVHVSSVVRGSPPDVEAGRGPGTRGTRILRAQRCGRCSHRRAHCAVLGWHTMGGTLPSTGISLSPGQRRLTRPRALRTEEVSVNSFLRRYAKRLVTALWLSYAKPTRNPSFCSPSRRTKVLGTC